MYISYRLTTKIVLNIYLKVNFILHLIKYVAQVTTSHQYEYTEMLWFQNSMLHEP